MSELHVVVLAAGKGTRMKSALPKVLHKAHGLPLIEHVLRAAGALNPASVVLIVGHQADTVREALGTRPGLHYAVQEPQLGTGHALLQAETALKGARGTVLLLSGDVPLLRTSTLQALGAAHEQRQAAATVLTAVLEDEDEAETVELTFTLADFDGPAEQPQAFFDSGAVTFLEVNGGEGTVSDGDGEEFDFALFLFDNEANLQALRLSDSRLFTACCSFAVTPAEGPPGAVIPEPSGATAFAVGAALVLAHLRRRQAPEGSPGSTRGARSA